MSARYIAPIWAALLVVLLAACTASDATSPSDAPAVTPSPTIDQTVASVALGEELFFQQVLIGPDGSASGCINCHDVQGEGPGITGPNLAGIASRAAMRVEGQSAEEYLRLAIVEPDDHLVDDFPAGAMPDTYDVILTETQIESLVLYMLTLE
jgi:hypothetical protein